MVTLRLMAVLLLAGMSAPVLSQAYPSKPVRILVGYAPGGGTDIMARAIGAKLTDSLKQQFVIENRPGANANIAAKLAADAPADGYTILFMSVAHIMSKPVYKNLGYDIERDFTPISQTSVAFAGIIMNPELPIAEVKDFIALSKKRPLNIGTIGNGSNYHLFGSWFALLTGADFNFVHYNTSAPVIDVVAGRLDAIFDGFAAHGGNLRAGKLKLLAVSGKERRSVFPDVPTFTQAGFPGFEPLAWGGFFAPTGTPAPIIDKINAAVVRVVRSQEMQDIVRASGNEPVGNSPGEFTAFVKSEQAKYSKVIKQLGIRLD